MATKSPVRRPRGAASKPIDRATGLQLRERVRPTVAQVRLQLRLLADVTAERDALRAERDKFAGLAGKGAACELEIAAAHKALGAIADSIGGLSPRKMTLAERCALALEKLRDATTDLAVTRKQAEGWKNHAAQQAGGSDYYQRLLRECAKHLGIAVRTCDDGTVTPPNEPLLAKVPELVAALAARANAMPQGWTGNQVQRNLAAGRVAAKYLAVMLAEETQQFGALERAIATREQRVEAWQVEGRLLPTPPRIGAYYRCADGRLGKLIESSEPTVIEGEKPAIHGAAASPSANGAGPSANGAPHR